MWTINIQRARFHVFVHIHNGLGCEKATLQYGLLQLHTCNPRTIIWQYFSWIPKEHKWKLPNCAVIGGSLHSSSFYEELIYTLLFPTGFHFLLQDSIPAATCSQILLHPKVSSHKCKHSLGSRKKEFQTRVTYDSGHMYTARVPSVPWNAPGLQVR